MIVGSLGNYIFMTSSLYTKTYNNFSQNSSVRWLEHKIIGEKPKLQFDGKNLEEIKLSIHLNTFFNVGVKFETDVLKEYMNKGKVLRLILGGHKVGKYVITNISNKPKAFDRLGNPTKTDLELSLKEYN